MRAKQTLNRNMTVATRQSASINVTGWCNAIRKGAVAWSKKKLGMAPTECNAFRSYNIRRNINRDDVDPVAI